MMKPNIYEILTILSYKIKEHYPTFANAFSMVKTDPERGLVFSYKKNKWVGLDDTSGNYFYIRVMGDFSANYSAKTSLSDCGLTILQTINCIVVAIVSSDIDELKLADALMSELLACGHIPAKGSIDRVSILRNELKGLKPEVINAAISKTDNKTIVSIEFKVLRTFSPTKCKIDLCKTC